MNVPSPAKELSGLQKQKASYSNLRNKGRANALRARTDLAFTTEQGPRPALLVRCSNDSLLIPISCFPSKRPWWERPSSGLCYSWSHSERNSSPEDSLSHSQERRHYPSGTPLGPVMHIALALVWVKHPPTRHVSDKGQCPSFCFLLQMLHPNKVNGGGNGSL